MSLIRLLTYVVFGAFIWFSIKNFLRKQENRNNPRPTKRAERIVKCLYCGVHLPEHEAITFENQYFCDQQHQRLWSVKRQK